MSADSGPRTSWPPPRSAATAGAMMLDIFAAELAAFAGMRIEPRHGQPRMRDAEIALQRRQHDLAGLDDGDRA